MAQNLNNCIFTGRLTRDPEINDSKTLCKFSMAVNSYGDKPANFFNFKAFKKTAELIYQYMRKGSELTVVCSATLEKWENDGKNHSAVSFYVNQMFFGQKPHTEMATPNDIPQAVQATQQVMVDNVNTGYGTPMDDQSVPF